MPTPPGLCVRLGALGLVLTLLLLWGSEKFRKAFLGHMQLPEPSSGRPAVHYLDGLRGVLALWVCLFHLWQWYGPIADKVGTSFSIVQKGVNAVPLFTVISGWLIYQSVKTAVERRSSVFEYLARRFLRIYPLYFFCLVLIYCLGFAGGAIRAPGILADVFMLRLFGSSRILNPPTWSLYVEEGFYLLAPLYFLAAKKTPVRLSLIGIAVMILLQRWVAAREFLLVKFFLVGIILGELNGRERFRAAAGRFAEHPLAAAAFAFSIYKLCRLDFLELHDQWKLVACSFVSFQFVHSNAWPQRIFAMKPLRILGAVSYSVYIVHPLVLAAQTRLLFDGAGGLLNGRAVAGRELTAPDMLLIYPSAIVFYALATFSLVEKPFLNLRRLIGKSRSVPAGA